MPEEGYVLHTYGRDDYLRHAVASVVTLRRYDTQRPVALYCPPESAIALQAAGLEGWFSRIEPLPEAHRSITGFKHHLDRFKPFERCLYVDCDMIWCRDPDPLWAQLATYPFTATGLERADFYFGGPKSVGVIWEFLRNRRERTLRRFNLTYLPRVQAGMLYAQDQPLTRQVCAEARMFHDHRAETHFRTRFAEGRSEESCEWSIAMALSSLRIPVFPWYQGYNSPQLDYIPGMTAHTEEFEDVRCRYYPDRFVYEIRGLKHPRVREACFSLAGTLLRRRDVFYVTPFALHFSWLHAKAPFRAFADRTWASLMAGDQVPPEAKLVAGGGMKEGGQHG